MWTKFTNYTSSQRAHLHINICLILMVIFLSKQTQGANATRCHSCLFHLAYCTNPLDCYNQPDTCSNTNFSPVLSQVIDCEFGCEQYVVTDATGAVVVWRRGCATQNAPKSTYICYSRVLIPLRHDQCWCHTDYCNSSVQVNGNFKLLVLASLAITTFLSLNMI